MNYLLILSGILSVVILVLLFRPIVYKKTVKHIKPTVVTPSYWITPSGPSWNPPKHHKNKGHNLGPGGLPPGQGGMPIPTHIIPQHNLGPGGLPPGEGGMPIPTHIIPQHNLGPGGLPPVQ